MTLGMSFFSTTVDSFLLFAFIRIMQKFSLGSGYGGRPSLGVGLSIPSSKINEIKLFGN